MEVGLLMSTHELGTLKRASCHSDRAQVGVHSDGQAAGHLHWSAVCSAVRSFISI